MPCQDYITPAAPDAVPQRPRKGRGAAINMDGRFEPFSHGAIDDGWGSADQEPEVLRTTLTPDTTRTIIARNKSPDVPFDRSINPYRGCEHGCIYCFARPTHAFLGLSPGLDFETRLFFKPDAARLLEKELRKLRYGCQVIAMGTNTDPYQPAERRLGITRGILQVLSDFNHPVNIVTKSALVLRDIDILAPMAAKGLAEIGISVTTLDRTLARTMEPRAAAPGRRLEVIRELSAAGIPVGVMAAPMIPALNDAELETILEAGRDAGAAAAGYILLRLPLEIKELFRDWLTHHAPDKAAHVMSLVRSTRGGADYDPAFGQRMKGSGAYAEILGNRFKVACKKLGLNRGVRTGLDVTQFRPPPAAGDQLSLL